MSTKASIKILKTKKRESSNWSKLSKLQYADSISSTTLSADLSSESYLLSDSEA
jgi:hypothetical protein